MKTAQFFNCLLATILLCTTGAKAQSWQWGISNTSSFTGVVEAAPTTVDPNGYSFAGGTILLADSITIGTHTVYDTDGHEEIIIVRADPSGNVSWVVNSTNDFSALIAMITDPNGNLYVLGQYYDSSFEMGTATLLNDTVDYPMQFLLKISPAGNVVWARNIASGATSRQGGLGLDASNNVYIAGSFGSPVAVIGTSTLYNTSPGGDSTDIYLAKYDYMGTPLWARSFGGHGNDHPIGLSVTKDGTIFLAGQFTSQTMNIGADVLTDSMYYATGTSPFQYPFLAKFDNTGSAEWARDINRHIRVLDIKAGADKSNYISGTIDSNTTFGIDTLTLTGTLTAVVAKYDSSGNPAWAGTASGIAYTVGYALGIDTCNNIWMAGSTDGMVNIKGSIIDTLPVGYDKVFIAAWDHCGNYIAGTGTQLGSGGDDGMGMALDQRGNLYIGGDYENIPLIVGPDTLPLPPSAKEYFFMAKYNYGLIPCNPAACCTTAPVASFTDTNASPAVSFYYTGTSGYDSIRWDFGDGSGSTTPNPVHNYITMGIFHACVFVYNSCGMDSSCSDIEILETGLHGLSQNTNIITYPNPAKNEYIIQNKAGFPAGASATLFDLTGRLIGSYALSGNKTIISVSSLIPGSYQCRIISGETVVVKKLVVMR